MSQTSLAASGACSSTLKGLEPDPTPVHKVRTSQVRDFLMENMAKESRRQRELDTERWEYLREQNSRTRHQWLDQLEEQMNEAHSKLQVSTNLCVYFCSCCCSSCSSCSSCCACLFATLFFAK